MMNVLLSAQRMTLTGAIYGLLNNERKIMWYFLFKMLFYRNQFALLIAIESAISQ